MKIGASLFLALKDCAGFGAGSYIWKPKSMQKLAALGLVEEVPAPYRAYGHIPAYTPTDAGRALIKEVEAA